MRFFVAALLAIGFSIAHAQVTELPGAEISAKTLGGTVLMLRMKHSLVIDGDVQTKITKELSEEGRKHFYRDMILDTDAKVLTASYGSAKHPATNEVIERYRTLLSEKQKLSLN